jgi:hypothetical protein
MGLRMRRLWRLSYYKVARAFVKCMFTTILHLSSALVTVYNNIFRSILQGWRGRYVIMDMYLLNCQDGHFRVDSLWPMVGGRKRR